MGNKLIDPVRSSGGEGNIYFNEQRGDYQDTSTRLKGEGEDVAEGLKKKIIWKRKGVGENQGEGARGMPKDFLESSGIDRGSQNWEKENLSVEEFKVGSFNGPSRRRKTGGGGEAAKNP